MAFQNGYQRPSSGELSKEQSNAKKKETKKRRVKISHGSLNNLMPAYFCLYSFEIDQSTRIFFLSCGPFFF